ncbi:beta-1,3-galactosyltransferase 5-like [Physella acuta]|uniref:beta-1,3-galactosyltransferase 5-like n=1 Tax=Physella acuta TaxID=109671 RepID=UPI0027DDE293|nr:beta-1,3-galactosyltransferase 5-like [Physella acuta]
MHPNKLRRVLFVLLPLMLVLAIFSNIYITLKAFTSQSTASKPPRIKFRYHLNDEPSEENKKLPYYSRQTLLPFDARDLLIPGSYEETMTKMLMRIRRKIIINDYSFKFHISPRLICDKKVIDLVLCITVPVDQFQEREDLRQTYRRKEQLLRDSLNVVTIFVVGEPSEDRSIQEGVEQEARTHGDIMQAGFVDTPLTANMKTLAALKWVNTYCYNATFTVKTSDECDINIPLVLTELRARRQKTPVFMLGKMATSQMKNPNTTGLHLPDDTYQLEKYPDYLYGASTGYPTEVGYLLYEAALRLPLFQSEEIYFSGICAAFIHIPRYDCEAFYFSNCSTQEEMLRLEYS